jgi:hypothetical protein
MPDQEWLKAVAMRALPHQVWIDALKAIGEVPKRAHLWLEAAQQKWLDNEDRLHDAEARHSAAVAAILSDPEEDTEKNLFERIADTPVWGTEHVTELATRVEAQVIARHPEYTEDPRYDGPRRAIDLTEDERRTLHIDRLVEFFAFLLQSYRRADRAKAVAAGKG